MAYIFSNILGVFVFNDDLHLIDKSLFKSNSGGKSKGSIEISLKNRHKGLKEPKEKELKEILAYFRKKEFFPDFYKNNIDMTREIIRSSVADDLLILQAVGSIEDLDKAINILMKRLREWYGLWNPEFSRMMESSEKFVQLILIKGKEELMKEIHVRKEESMGAELKREDIEAMKSLASHINGMYNLRKGHEAYLESVMKNFCPNLAAVAGVLTGAKLIQEAGSLKKLSIMPSSTVQILGAEKALFRHMKTGAKPPKYGILYSHSLIQRQSRGNQGRAARALADKISIAARVDYFKGQFIGDKLRKEVEDKFSKE